MTNSKPTIYLAGPVMSLDDGGASWREDVEAYCCDAIDTRNPLSKYNIPVEQLTVVDGDSGNDDRTVSVSEIVENDKRLLDESDGVLVGYSAVRSIGTPMEVMWAYERDMPVVLWSRDETPLSQLSPWYRYHVDHVTPTLSIALHTLEQLIRGETDE